MVKKLISRINLQLKKLDFWFTGENKIDYY